MPKLDYKKLTVLSLVFIVGGIIPAAMIAHSNKTVFPDTIYMANGMLMIAIGTELICMIAASAKNADHRIIVAACVGLVAVGVMTWYQLGGHWSLSREMSAASSSVKEAEKQNIDAMATANQLAEIKERESRNRAAELQSAAKYEQQRAIRLDAEKRSGIRSSNAQASAPSLSLGSSIGEGWKMPVITPRIRPEDVMASWMDDSKWFNLTDRAYLETGVCMLIIMLIAGMWHLDLNGNNIPDRVERLSESQILESYPQWYTQITGKPMPQTQTAKRQAGFTSETQPGN